MNILLVSAEVSPYAKTGGLADVTSSLPRQWQKYGQNPIVVMPKYSFIDTAKYGFKPTGLKLNVPMGFWEEYAWLWSGKLPDSDVPVFLVENDSYFGRKGIYGDPHEYFDNDRRFIFLSRAVFEAAKALDFTPDIIHAHDFHTAFSLAFLKSQYRHDLRFFNTAGIYTIHNLAYQGKFNPHRIMEFAGFGISEFYPGSWFEHYGVVNAMKTGIMFADKITTVSPTYAKEIRNPYFGEGMHNVLNHRGAELVGILNGADYDEWNPGLNNTVIHPYSVESLGIKESNKKALLDEFGIVEDGLDLPVIGMVSRLAEQKGLDIIFPIIEKYLLDKKFRFVVLGSGEQRYVDHLNYLNEKYPGIAIVYIGYDNDLAHRIFAASDFIFVPSRFEPCGLTQMYAMRFGALPIVRKTGGLADTVREYNSISGEGNGFVFLHYNSEDLAFAIDRAIAMYKVEPYWNLARKNAMLEDYSVTVSALEYLNLFKWALEKVRL